MAALHGTSVVLLLAVLPALAVVVALAVMCCEACALLELHWLGAAAGAVSELHWLGAAAGAVSDLQIRTTDSHSQDVLTSERI
jgi:hypothetical protein